MWTTGNDFPIKKNIFIHILSHACYMIRPFHPPWFCDPNNKLTNYGTEAEQWLVTSRDACFINLNPFLSSYWIATRNHTNKSHVKLPKLAPTVLHYCFLQQSILRHTILFQLCIPLRVPKRLWQASRPSLSQNNEKSKNSHIFGNESINAAIFHLQLTQYIYNTRSSLMSSENFFL